MFSVNDLKSLSKYKDPTYNFDLSYISIDNFKPLISALCKFGLTEITGLGFNCNTYEYDQKEQKGEKLIGRKRVHHPPVEMESSIFINKRENLVPELIGFLSRILPKTESIRILKFKGFRFSSADVDVLSQSVDHCVALRVLKLRNIDLYDEGFERLAESLKHKGLITLQCRNCKLTDDISKTVLDLIECHTIIQREAEKKADRTLGIVCLSVMDFRENRLTQNFLTRVKKEVESSPMIRLDLRGNAQIDQCEIQSTKILAGDNVPEDGMSGLSQTEQTRKAQLMRENARLRQTLNMLTHGEDIQLIGRDLYAIGKRAKELAQQLDAFDNLCSKMEEEQTKRPPRQTSSRRRPKRLIHRQYLNSN